MSVLGAGEAFMLGAADEADTYIIPKSLRFNSGDSAYLSKTFASAGNRRTWTWSGWFKRQQTESMTNVLFASYTNTSNRFYIGIQGNSDKLLMFGRVGGSDSMEILSDQVFRDFGAWYHMVVAIDSTQSSSSDRVKVYVNGSQISLTTTTALAQNGEPYLNAAAPHRLGFLNGSSLFNGLMADVQFVDGQALAPTDFGETRSSDGVWVPKEYAGSYGPAIDQTQTWSSAAADSYGFDGSTAYNSAATRLYGTSTYHKIVDANNPFTNVTSVVVGTSENVGNIKLDGTVYTTSYTSGVGLTVTSPPSSFSDIEVLGASNGVQITYVKISGVLLVDPGVTVPHNGFHLNFSDNSSNQALGFDSAPTIPDLDPKKGMDVITYTGNGGTQNIGGALFEPGLVWLKVRNEGSRSHSLYDTVRGASKVLKPDATDAEVTMTGVTSFNPDGFTLGSHVNSNNNNYNYVAWTWRAGGPAVANTDGSITTEVSANTDYGFSIIKYTGVDNASTQTIGHGLGKVPKWVVIKNLTDSEDWAVYHASVGNTKYLQLNSTAAAADSDAYWNDTDPTSALITLNNSNDVQRINRDYIVYAWSEISGYSKFSSYSGTGSTHTVDCGFRPAFLIVKSSTGSYNWQIKDKERGDVVLFADTSGADASDGVFDFTDNGFTVTGSGNATNASGQTYIFAAFADRPGNNWDVNNIVTNEGLTTSKTQFDVVTYTGNGQTTQSIDSLAFQPDFVWIKGRNAAAGHVLMDSVRGTGNKVLSSHNTAAEGSETYGQIQSFDSNGFTVEAGSTSAENSNYNNRTYVAWCWKAGGTAVSNTDGSITSSVSANAQYGFSIVSYTGSGSAATVGHGLSTTPGLVICKDRSASDAWLVWTKGFTSNEYLYLNTNAAKGSYSGTWGSTPTNSVFGVSDQAANQSGNNFVAYCFADVPGYQRIGSYTGNGSSTGPVVVTGFKPRFLLIKNTSLAGSNWFIFDSERSPSNPVKLNLKPNDSASEETDSSGTVDFNENGFQIKSAGTHPNGSGNTIIYLAIGDDEIGSDEDCLVDVPNAVTADADATDTTGGYQRGNYATLNPLNKHNSNNTLSDGNLEFTTSGSDGCLLESTIGMSSGKFYFEVVYSRSGTGQLAGIRKPGARNYNDSYIYVGTGNKYTNGGSGTSYGATLAHGDVIGTAFDATNGTLEFFKNGVSQGQAFSGISGTYSFFVGSFGSAPTGIANFGQMRFKYPIPSGYAALNTTALPAATIADGSAQFDTKLYTGNGSTQTINGYEYSPDLVWIKNRNTSGYWHELFDSVRGVSRRIFSNSTSAENFRSGQGLTAFNNDGFTLTYVDANDNGNNSNGNTFVAWAWNAGSSTVSNTDGSITSSVRANPTAGFSIVKAPITSSGGTIGHGLNASPGMLILKNIGSSSTNWVIWHSSFSTNDYILLNSTSAKANSVNLFNGNSSTTFTVGSGFAAGTADYICYCFAPVSGYSAFGKYTGNSSSDGVFVNTGFRPAWLMVKSTNATGSWSIFDNKRDPFNVMDRFIYAEQNFAEQDSDTVDFVSNGFKLRTGGGDHNYSGRDYVYIAFAKNPFQANGGLAR
tara:strand:+ start:71 stop:4798 length:4728 start_codon:yes stop_codon:yes gene_type:complete